MKFCHRIGLSYVSCSPFRVPVARLAAAQAAIADKQKPAGGGKGKSKKEAADYLKQSARAKALGGFLFQIRYRSSC